MLKIKYFLAIFIASVIFPAYAQRPKTVFSCTTVLGNQVKVESIGNSYRYSFGKRGQRRQLVFSQSKRQVIALSPRGPEIIRFRWRAMVMENKGYRYRVYTAIDSATETVWMGVSVWNRHKNKIRDEECSKRYPIIDDMDEPFDGYAYGSADGMPFYDYLEN